MGEKTMKNENEITKSLFGSAKINLGGHTVPPEKILAPFEFSDSFARVFCENCGAVMEATKEELQQYISRTNNPTPVKGGYFEVDGCGVCGQDPEKVAYRVVFTH